ncbi:hypothetical protein ACWC91_41140, partial [Streptomyces sp. NPDC001204]
HGPRRAQRRAADPNDPGAPMHRATSLLLAALLAAALVACSSHDTDPTPTKSPTTTRPPLTPTPSPTEPAPSPSGSDDPADATPSPSGL